MEEKDMGEGEALGFAMERNPEFHSVSELISQLLSSCPHLSAADGESMGFAMERNPEFLF